MATLLLSVLPIASIMAVFVYALAAGLRMYRSSGQVSILGVAATIAGLTLGRLVDRYIPLPRAVDEWLNSGGDRFLALLRAEVALLFLFAAVVSFLAITLIRRDARGQLHPESRSRQLPLLWALFAFAVGITARSKLAALLAYLMDRAHLL
jgi:MFS family permease